MSTFNNFFYSKYLSTMSLFSQFFFMHIDLQKYTSLNIQIAFWGFALNSYFYLNDIYFPIPPPQIRILPKPWFTIMGVDPPYSNFFTDKIFSRPLQSIRRQSIWFPLYLSNNLNRFGRRHKCPQHPPTQQGYLPVQFPDHWVSPESTQGGLVLWCWVDTTSFPLHHERVISVYQGGWVVKTCS